VTDQDQDHATVSTRTRKDQLTDTAGERLKNFDEFSDVTQLHLFCLDDTHLPPSTGAISARQFVQAYSVEHRARWRARGHRSSAILMMSSVAAETRSVTDRPEALTARSTR
jgi:hypothetical protein